MQLRIGPLAVIIATLFAQDFALAQSPPAANTPTPVVTTPVVIDSCGSGAWLNNEGIRIDVIACDSLWSAGVATAILAVRMSETQLAVFVLVAFLLPVPLLAWLDGPRRKPGRL
jgi:hypothetical protein